LEQEDAQIMTWICNNKNKQLAFNFIFDATAKEIRDRARNYILVLIMLPESYQKI
jgi:hypothetical protein